MKRTVRRWILRLSVTVGLVLALLLIIVLNPVLSYANKTSHKNFTIYHNRPLDVLLGSRIDEAASLLSSSEFYRADLRLDICLNDGSLYPGLINTLRGRAFAWGFYNKVVLQGAMDCGNNVVELSGYKWNLSQLLAHEMVHCLQYDHLGFWKSKPVASFPEWKWEGYAEYIARRGEGQRDLAGNIERFNKSDSAAWEVRFDDGTIAPREYYRYWMLVQYCLDVKKMSYTEILKDEKKEEDVWKEMMDWYTSTIPKYNQLN